ncbi:MAG: MlaD family protein [Desulfobacterales bacterium]|jgi:phospholipid/cholesterol/gamma-HCH transport system substrate-binding protein
MASPRTKFAVGLFMASGMIFAVLITIWLGMSRFLEKGQYYVTYFNESVQGLDIDSPVKYRGVFVGRVDNIGVAPDSKLIKVVLKIESGQTLDSGIVAQLKSVGITGSMFVELDQKKEDEADQSPSLSFPSEYPIVASKPSEIGELISGINEVIDQVKSLDLQEISKNIKLTLQNINQKVTEANVKGISNSMESALARVEHILDDQRWDTILTSVEKATQSVNSLLRNADRTFNRAEDTILRVEGIVADKGETVKTAIDQFNQAMTNANIFLQKGSTLVDGTDKSVSHLMHSLVIVAHNLEKASENLNQIMDTLADQPSQLLFGEPPVPRNVETDIYDR